MANTGSDIHMEDSILSKSDEPMEKMDFTLISDGSNTGSVSDEKDEMMDDFSESGMTDESGADDAADVLDLEKLQGLLEQSKQAADKIADKDVMLLIGGTGAGKTTTTLYLAGATFEESIIGGVEHYEPRGLPDEVLAEFAVSGSATSVTKTIHATTIDLPNGETFTICDTPGFGDTKGIEMEISNGLGVIHALKKAKSVKPVLVFDREVMAGGRFAMLRKTLEIVVLMMGKQSDFSSFEYAFTRCDRKKRKRIHEQLAHFQQSRNETTGESISDDEAVLDALLSDMIKKTAPEAINIEPDDEESRSDKLDKLWTKDRLDSPETAFNDFVSEDSSNKLSIQVSLMKTRMDVALKQKDFISFKAFLQKLVDLAENLPLPVVKSALEDGRNMGRSFVGLFRSQAESFTDRMATTKNAEAFKKLVSDFSVLLQTFSGLDSLSELCEVPKEESYESILSDNTKKIFGEIQSDIEEVKENAGTDGWNKDLQTALLRLSYAIAALEAVTESDKLLPLYQGSIDIVNRLVSVQLSSVEATLKCPTSDGLEASRDNIFCLLNLNQFFRASKGNDKPDILNPDQWLFLNDRLHLILSLLEKRSQACCKKLNEHIHSLESPEDFTKSMSCKSLSALSCDDEKIQCRAFLRGICDSMYLWKVTEEHTKEADGRFCDPGMDVAHFDVVLSSSLKEFAAFAQGWASEKQKHSEKKPAEKLLNSIESALKVCKSYRETDPESGEDSSESLEETEGGEGDRETDPNSVENSWESLIKTEERVKVFIEKCNLLPQRADELLYGPDVLGKKFHARLVELRAFKLQHGHCLVPQAWERNPSLGRWVNDVRKAGRLREQGLPTHYCTLTDERMEALADLDFVWKLKRGSAVGLVKSQTAKKGKRKSK